MKQFKLDCHSCESGNPCGKAKNKKQILAYARMTHTQEGFTMVLMLVAAIVLFTTFSFIKVGTLSTIQPDLRRIGINIGPDSSPSSLAENQTTNPNQDSEVDNTTALTVASDSLDVDADVDIDSEGDNPIYIE